MKRTIGYGIVGLLAGCSLDLLLALTTPAAAQAGANNSAGGSVALVAAIVFFALGAYQSNRRRISAKNKPVRTKSNI